MRMRFPAAGWLVPWGVLLLAAGAAAGGAGAGQTADWSAVSEETQAPAQAEELWSGIVRELEVVLLAADPTLASEHLGAARWGRGDVAQRVEAVLSWWRSRRGADAAAAAPPVPEALIGALQRVAVHLQDARRLQGRPAARRALLAEHLGPAVRDLRSLVGQHGGGGTRPPEASLTPQAAPANDACAAATPIGAGRHDVFTFDATNDGSASCGDSAGGADVWFLFTATLDATVSFGSVGGYLGVDPVVSLHSGCPGTIANELRCHDETSAVFARFSRPMTAGEQVWIRVSGAGGAAGAFLLEVEEGRQITGTVTDSATGSPLAGVTVSIYDDPASFGELASTLQDGTYASGALADGDHYAVAWSDTHLDEVYDDVSCGNGCPVFEGTPIPVGPGVDSSGVDFALDPGGSISGTVTGVADGQPLEDVPVFAFDADGDFVSSDRTASDGTYTVGGLPPGTGYASAGAFTYLSELYSELPCSTGCEVTSGDPIPVVAGADTPGVDFTLELGGAITGTVIDAATAAPLASLQVAIYGGGGFRSSSTAPDGTYRIGGMTTGTYYARTFSNTHPDELYDDLPCGSSCTPADGTPISVVQGLTTPGIDFALGAGGQFGAVSGRVTEAGTGAPLAGVGVTAYDAPGRPLASTATGVDGSYLLGGLPAGDVRLMAGPTTAHAAQLHPGLPFGLDLLAGSVVAVVGDGLASGVDFALWPLGACGFPESLRLASVTVASVAEYVACGTVTVGPGVAVDGAAEVTLRGGQSVSLASGVAVEAGARLAMGPGAALPPPSGDTVYAEDFDDGFALGWDTSNAAGDLWRLDGGGALAPCSPAPAGHRTLAFSRSAPDCDYDLGSRPAAGWARSPVIDLSAAALATLWIVHSWESENSSFYDVKRIEASADGGATWTTVWTTVSTTSDGFLGNVVDVSAFTTSAFRFRMVFDSVDGFMNEFPGWYVDEVSVTVH